MVNKATRAPKLCIRLAGSNWGCNFKALLWVYNMAVKPFLTCGSVILAKKVQLAAASKALTKVQRLACQCIPGAIHSCSTAAMELIPGLSTHDNL